VGEVDADALAALDHRRRRRGTGDQSLDRMVDALAQLGRRVDQHAVDDRRPAQMRHMVLADQREHLDRVDPAQAHAGAGIQRHGPRKAPTVAVEHRQRPQVGGVRRHAPRDDVAGGVQVGAAMVVDHTLGIAGRAGRVVQSDGIPFVAGQPPRIGRIAAGQEILVVQVAQRLARRGGFVFDLDHQRTGLRQQCQRLFDHRGELPVRQQHARAAMLQHERDRLGIQARIQGVEHGAAHRHPEVRFEQGRHVGQDRGHRVALAQSAGRQCAGQAPASFVGQGPVLALAAVDQRHPLRIYRSRPLDEAQRRQRDEVGRIAVQAHVVLIDPVHGRPTRKASNSPARIRRRGAARIFKLGL
jgi:hypothetical protein